MIIFKILVINKKCTANYGCCTSKRAHKNKDANNNEELNQATNILIETGEGNHENEKKYKILILDFVSVQFIDEAGFKSLKEIISEYERANVKLLLTNCNGNNFLWILFIYKISKFFI